MKVNSHYSRFFGGRKNGYGYTYPNYSFDELIGEEYELEVNEAILLCRFNRYFNTDIYDSLDREDVKHCKTWNQAKYILQMKYLDRVEDIDPESTLLNIISKLTYRLIKYTYLLVEGVEEGIGACEMYFCGTNRPVLTAALAYYNVLRLDKEKVYDIIRKSNNDLPDKYFIYLSDILRYLDKSAWKCPNLYEILYDIVSKMMDDIYLIDPVRNLWFLENENGVRY